MKAYEISVAHERIGQSARILTDVRPVFADDSVEIVGYLVNHHLQIDHFGGVREPTRFSVALDDEDVEKLGVAVARALLKSKALRNQLGETHFFNRAKEDSIGSE